MTSHYIFFIIIVWTLMQYALLTDSEYSFKTYLNLFKGSLLAEAVRDAFLGSKFCCFHLRYLAVSFKSLAMAVPMPEFNFSNSFASRCKRLKWQSKIKEYLQLLNYIHRTIATTYDSSSSPFLVSVSSSSSDTGTPLYESL